MYPSDAYQHKIKQYHNSVHQAEQLHTMRKDSRFQPDQPVSRQRATSGHPRFVSATTYAMFVGLITAFTLLTVIAYG